MEYFSDISFVVAKVLQLCGSLLLLISSFKKITRNDLNRAFGLGEYVPVNEILNGEITMGPYKEFLDNHVKNIVLTRFSLIYIFGGFLIDVYGSIKIFSPCIITILIVSGVILLSLITNIIVSNAKNHILNKVKKEK